MALVRWIVSAYGHLMVLSYYQKLVVDPEWLSVSSCSTEQGFQDKFVGVVPVTVTFRSMSFGAAFVSSTCLTRRESPSNMKHALLESAHLSSIGHPGTAKVVKRKKISKSF